MKIFLKPLFNLFTDQITLFNNPIIEIMLKAIIGVIAFKLAWNIVHELYRTSVIKSKDSGSLIHWITRGIFFYILCVVVCITTGIINFCITYWKILLIVGAVVGMGYYKIIKRRNT